MASFAVSQHRVLLLGISSSSPSPPCTSLISPPFSSSCAEPPVPFLPSSLRLKITCEPLNCISGGRKKMLKAARRNNLRHIILNASSYQNKSMLGGVHYLQEQQSGRSWEFTTDKVLVLGEGACIAAATATLLASILNSKSQESRLVTSSKQDSLTMASPRNIPVWQDFFLLAALFVNAVIRTREWAGRGVAQKRAEKQVDAAVEERVKKLEEEVASAVTIVRVLSKQLEKLSVRFRVTRQTLRDPIQETALLAEKTSEAVSILAAREDFLEKGLEEIQTALFGMQENQTKQLELISSLGKLVKAASKVEKPMARGSKKGDRMKGSRMEADEDSGVLHKGSTNKLGSLMKRGGNNTRSLESLTSGQEPMRRDPLRPPQQRAVTGLVDSKELARVNDIGWKPPQRVDFWLDTSSASRQPELESQNGDSLGQ